MENLKFSLLRYPLAYCVAVTFFSVSFLFLLKAYGLNEEALFDLPRLFILSSLSFAVCFTLYKCGWATSSGLTLKYSRWHSKWHLAIIPFLLIVVLSATSANWQDAEFSAGRVTAWLVSNFATGFFEELLMRGFCFYLLLKAWGTTRKGVYLAAIAQAMIFGMAHFANLLHMPPVDVLAQVTFSTLIGIGFAGLVYLTKSLWPAILVHTFINCAGTANNFLVPGYVNVQSPGIASYVVIIVLFLILSVLPGMLYMRSSGTAVTQA